MSLGLVVGLGLMLCSSPAHLLIWHGIPWLHVSPCIQELS